MCFHGANKFVKNYYTANNKFCHCGCNICNKDDRLLISGPLALKFTQKVPENLLAFNCSINSGLHGLNRDEIVLNLGAGISFECLLAAAKVGEGGLVIGIDKRFDIAKKAREYARLFGIKNLILQGASRMGLGAPDSSIDVVISNCVINFPAPKAFLYKEICRVLKPYGRLSISDIALVKKPPREIEQALRKYFNCTGKAYTIDYYKRIVKQAGLQRVKIAAIGPVSCINTGFYESNANIILTNLGKSEVLSGYVVSILVEGYK